MWLASHLYFYFSTIDALSKISIYVLNYRGRIKRINYYIKQIIMIKLNTYLNFPGTAEEAFNFYKSVFGGEFEGFQRFKEVPASSGMKPIEGSNGEKMMHISLPIGGNVLMASDSLGFDGKPLTVGDNFNISVSVDSDEEADIIFAKLSEGGRVEMPLGKTFWNAYFGMLVDKFGIWWMINHDHNQK
jgi:PhnB protein